MASMRKKISTRWQDASGKRVPAHTPGAVKVQEESSKWYAFDVPGHSRPVPLARNKGVSETLFARLIVAGESDVAGIPVRGKARTLEELLIEWETVMIDNGNEAVSAEMYVRRCRFIITARKWKYPREITPEGVQADLAGRMRREKRPIGPATRNHYLTAIKAFVHWLAGRGRRLVPSDLLDTIPLLPVEVDLRHARRALTAEELGRLLVTTLGSTFTFRGMTGPRRHCLYSLACATGFRSRELASLTPAHFDLVKGQALMPARRGKNRKTTRQPLPTDIVDLVRSYTQEMAADDRLFPGTWWEKGAKMLRHDLAAVGIPYKIDTPDGPLFADFHALKHTYVTLLEAAGVSLRDAMILARHSDPKLTLARYGRSQEEALAREVQRLPVVGGGVSQEEAERILLGWVLMGWCWWTSLGCSPGCPSETDRTEPERTKADKSFRKPKTRKP